MWGGGIEEIVEKLGDTVCMWSNPLCQTRLSSLSCWWVASCWWLHPANISLHTKDGCTDLPVE